jgi:acetyl esterase/lipase
MAIDTARRVTIEEDVVFGTGGGGDRKQLRGYGILLGREGYLCVCSEYRLSGEAKWPAQIHDVKAALRWMRANHADLGLDPERIAIEGNSAGAHLSLVAGGTPNLSEFEGEGGNPGAGTQVSAVISIYGPSDLVGGEASEQISSLMGTDTSEDRMRGASPVSYATPDYPPTMLIHGTSDMTVPWQSSLRMHEALQEAGVPVEAHYFAEQPHAFDREPTYGRQTASLMRLFLARYIGVPQEA